MKRYVARFVAQAWVNDYAIEVDAQGPTTWDATAFVQAADPEWVKATLERGADHDDILRLDDNAPEWVREYQGPFETYLRAVDVGDQVDEILEPLAKGLT